MTARAIDDPGSLGWEYDSATGRWTWGGSSNDGGGGTGGGIPEAPVNGKQYGRQDAGWTEVVSGGGSGDGDVDLSNVVEKDHEGTQYMTGINHTLVWGYDDGEYVVSIGEGLGTGADIAGSALFIETDNGSYSFNAQSFFVRRGKIQGGAGATIAGFTSVQATDFLDANGNSIIGVGGDGGGSGGIPEAPLDGNEYVRKSGDWEVLEESVKLSGNQTVEGEKTWSDDATFKEKVYAESFVKLGGNSNQYLMADGSVTYATDGGGGEIGEGGSDPRITDEQIAHWDTAYLWGDHSTKDYATEDWVVGKSYATETWVNDKSFATEAWVNDRSYATEGWVNNKGYSTESWVGQYYQPKGNYLTSSDLGSYATTSWVGANYQPKGAYLTSADLTGYATTTWVDSAYQPKGSYAASNHTHTGYAASNHTHSGYLTSSDLTPYATTVWVDTAYQAKGQCVLLSGNSTVAGTVTATDFVASSDKSKKKSIVTAPLGTVEQLRGVEFEWKDSGEMASGVIAQEVEKVLPHLVHKDDKGDLAVSYMGLIGYLIEEVKDLRREIEEMK